MKICTIYLIFYQFKQELEKLFNFLENELI